MINIKTLAKKLVKKGVIEKTSQLDYLFCTTDNGNLKKLWDLLTIVFVKIVKKKRNA
jgi:hypothetical protein